MAVDRLRADHRQLGDLLAGVALRDQLDHLLLARRQRSSGSRSPRPSAVERVADQRGDGGGVEERLAAHRRAAGLHEVAVRARLQHVARRARLERLEEVLLVVVHREHQHADLRPAARGARARPAARSSAASPRRGRRGRRPRERQLGGPRRRRPPRRRPRGRAAASSTIRSPPRTSAWSSASRMRVFSGASPAAVPSSGTDRRTRVPLAGPARCVEPPADEQRPLAHPADARACRSGGVRQPAAVVARR